MEIYNTLSKSMVLKQVWQQNILHFLAGSRLLPYLNDDIDIMCLFKLVSGDEFKK